MVAPGYRADLNVIDLDALGFDVPRMAFDLPAGLTVGSGAQSNTCGGTVTAAAGASQVVLSGSTSVAATGNCLVSIPVQPAAAGAPDRRTADFPSQVNFNSISIF